MRAPFYEDEPDEGFGWKQMYLPTFSGLDYNLSSSGPQAGLPSRIRLTVSEAFIGSPQEEFMGKRERVHFAKVGELV